MRPVGELGVDLRFPARSGASFKITTGQDDNRDGLFTDRPERVAWNSARTAAYVDLSEGVSYRWRYGSAESGAGGGVARRLVELSLNLENVLNRDNFIGYSGVMTSPFFLQPTNVLATRRATLRLRVEL